MIIACLIFLMLLSVLYAVSARSSSDLIAITILVFLVYYGFRAILIATGLDSPSPDYLFAVGTYEAAYVRTIFGISLFVSALVAFSQFGSVLAPRQGTLGFRKDRYSVASLGRLAGLLTTMSVTIGALLLIKYGSFGGVVVAAKVGKEFAGLGFIRIPAVLGAITSLAAFQDSRIAGDRRRAAWFFLLAIVNSAVVFMWGQRSIAVIPVAVLLIASPKVTMFGSKRVPLARMILAGVSVVSVALSLRYLRDSFTSNGSQSSFSEQNVWRQISQAVNGVYFDSSLLAFRDWPKIHMFRQGEDFIAGLLGPVPRLLWPEKPVPNLGVWFRQVYEPQALNGWPVGSVGDWYLNFGFLGIVVGGAFSGILIGVLNSNFRNAGSQGINQVAIFVYALYIFPQGITANSPLQAVAWGVPLWLTMKFLPPLRSTQETLQEGVER
ncbi:oligosaccharide repeat unit polymerase [Nocardioides sp. GY 10127]|nr:oligosaccharide repeat unit polymerase [Nocardioides sp. GY 10127]